jgi:hypothetical protein
MYTEQVVGEDEEEEGGAEDVIRVGGFLHNKSISSNSNSNSNLKNGKMFAMKQQKSSLSSIIGGSKIKPHG